MRPALDLGEAVKALHTAHSRPEDAFTAAASVRHYLACACAVLDDAATSTRNPMFRVLSQGVPYQSAALTAAEEAALHTALDRAGIRFPMKQCFSNAQRLWQYASGDDRFHFRYVEGWATTELDVPLHHAWLSLHGKVIDLTLRRRGARPAHRGTRLRDRVVGVIPKGWGYIGVEIPWADVRARIIETREWGSMFYRW